MIGLDTNILIRYLTQDDKEQAALATKLIEEQTGIPHSIFINNIVLCELIWVLDRGYKYKKENIICVLRHIFSTEEFAFENQNILWEALDEFENNSLDFSDALIANINHTKGCKKSYTFDKEASLSRKFSLLEY